MWLNEKTAWLYPPLRSAQRRMHELAGANWPTKDLGARLRCQAGRELLLAQASDWPFMLTGGAAADYARQRFTSHVDRFQLLVEQLGQGCQDDLQLSALEQQDNLFPQLDWRYWA